MRTYQQVGVSARAVTRPVAPRHPTVRQHMARPIDDLTAWEALTNL